MFSRRAPVSEEKLRRATQRLYHRGPDGQKYWISKDARVGFGHARLSIIDLKTGDQPIGSEDEQIHIVVNGEFYGYEAIQRELEQAGHCLRTRSDSEILLHLYEDGGSQCLHRLRGEYAFVLWDETNRTLFAGRDRFGIKPLFYAIHEDALCLASEVKALFAAGVPARWDEGCLGHSLVWAGHQMRTLFAGVFQIPPGHYLIATDNHVSLHQYWDFSYPTATSLETTRCSDADYVAEFRERFEEAVRIRLRADVPVGCYLSGGLDSCAVLGMAAKHHPEPIKAFTLTFDHADYDEGAIAEEMAAKVGAEFYPISIRQDDLANHFADAVLQSENLCFNAHGVAKYLLSRAVRDAGYKVVITGEGSDEILGGYAHFRRDILLYNRQGQDPNDVKRLLEELERANPVSRGLLLPHGEAGQLVRVKRLLGFIPSWMETFSARGAKLRALLSPDFAEQHVSMDEFYPLLMEIDVRNRMAGRDPLNQSLYLWAKTALPWYILTILGDRMEMAHSIEGRLPFLDHHVVEAICLQPVAMKIRGMTEKFVLREAVRDSVTETVYRRQKHPFLSPPATLNPDARLNAFVQDTLRGPVMASIPFFDRKQVTDLLDRLAVMDEGSQVANDQVLMMLASACVLQRGFGLTT